MTNGMPGEERSGEGMNHMTSDMMCQGSKLQGQRYARKGKVTLGAKPHRTVSVTRLSALHDLSYLANFSLLYSYLCNCLLQFQKTFLSVLLRYKTLFAIDPR